MIFKFCKFTKKESHITVTKGAKNSV